MNKKILVASILLFILLVGLYIVSKQERENIDDGDKTSMPELLVFRDAGLISYYEETIKPRCPVGEPNWAEYRACILAMLEEEKAAFTGTQETMNAYDDYCTFGASFAADEYSNGYAEIYNVCMLYKIAKANLVVSNNAVSAAMKNNVFTVRRIVNHYPSNDDNSQTELIVYEQDSEHVRNVVCLFPPSLVLSGSNEMGWSGLNTVKIDEQPAREYVFGQVGYYCEKVD